MCIPLSLLRTSWVKTLLRQRIQTQQQKNFRSRIFCVVRIVSRECRRLFLPRTSFYNSFSCLFNDAVSVKGRMVQRELARFPNYSEKTHPSTTVSISKSHMTWPGTELRTSRCLCSILAIYVYKLSLPTIRKHLFPSDIFTIWSFCRCMAINRWISNNIVQKLRNFKAVYLCKSYHVW
jgi:hypothetical protein